MKSLAFLVFLFLAMPGSGQLAWDGLPFSTRIEFASLILIAVVTFSQLLRSKLLELLGHFRWRGLIKPVLVALCLLKLLSFAWSPLGAGYGACYRSLYQPLEVEKACEKSYEAPFIQGHGLPVAQISRVDDAVDFGGQMHDWRLPFMNEFNRFPVLWISRFPFTAEYSAVVRNDSLENRYLPLRAIGELSVSLNGKLIVNEKNYDSHFLSGVPLPAGASKLKVYFQYRDDTVSKLPDNAPAPLGPYAQLKIGAPESSDDLLAKARVLITGSRGSLIESRSFNNLVIRDRDGREVAHTDKKTDTGQTDYNPPTRNFIFEIEVPAASLAASPLEIFATGSNETGALATINTSPQNPFILQVSQAATTNIAISASLTTDRESIHALQPGLQTDLTLVIRILLLIVDFFSLVITAALAVVVIRSMRFNLLKAIGVAALTWIAVNPFYALLPGFVGGGRELVVPYALVAILIVGIRRPINKFPLAFLLPISTVLAAQKVFEHVYYNHPGEGENWWGKLIFYWRDSDWYTNHGNARDVFVDSFLRGGESVFYVRAAPRYLIFSGQLLLGENDILIGLISVTVGFMVVCVLGARFADYHDTSSGRIVSVFITFIGLIFLGDQIITAFGFLVTSEYTTWIGLLGIIAFLLGHYSERRVWVTTTVAAIVASLAHFRPNIVFVCVALLPLVLYKADRRNLENATRQIAWAVTVFFVILPLSLVHNLYYSGRFVPFTENSAQTVGFHKRFYWTKVWSELGIFKAIETIWEQLRVLMYWVIPNDPNLAIIFWGSQLVLISALFLLAREKRFLKAKTLITLLPLTYVVPMLSYNLTSYYPRHIVTASLLCLGSALLVWPRAKQSTS